MRTMESFMTLSEFNHHVYCLSAIQHVLKWFHSTFNHFVLKWFNSTLKLRWKIAWCYPLAIHIVHGFSFITSLWIPSTFTIFCWVFFLCWSFLYLWKSHVQNWCQLLVIALTKFIWVVFITMYLDSNEMFKFLL
jgi:hypothetical protein